MLNPASRFTENAAHAALLRPFAIFFVIALLLAVTSRQPVRAASRERSTRHASSTKLQPGRILTHAYPVGRHRAESASRAKSRRNTRNQAAQVVPSSRGRRRTAVLERRTRRRSGSRSVVVRDVAMIRPAARMVRPVPGASSLIEATPGSVAIGTPHPGDAPTPNTELAANAPASALSASEMAQAAVAPHVFPMYTRTGRLVVPPPLRGSREILVHQNQMADAAGLERIENDEALDRLRYTHQLVEVGGRGLAVNPELPENRRFARPWTARFASDIARAYYTRFGQPLELNSAVRTISYQLRLQRVNGNAAAIEGETASPHLT